MRLVLLTTDQYNFYWLSLKYLQILFLHRFTSFVLITNYVQYGFRRKHSIEYVALELFDRIMTEMDQSNYTRKHFC